MLNLRNEELAQLTQQYLRRMEATDVPVTPAKREKSSQSLDKARLPQYNGSASTSTLNDEVEPRMIRMGKPDALEIPASSFRPPKFLKWSGKASREHLTKEPAINIVPPEMAQSKPRSTKEHAFQHFSALRFVRCDHCGDKMWGSHLRCTGRCPEFISYISYQLLIQFRLQYVRPPEVPPSCSYILFSGWWQKRASFQRWSAPYALFLYTSAVIRSDMGFSYSAVYVWSRPNRTSSRGCKRQGALCSCYR